MLLKLWDFAHESRTSAMDYSPGVLRPYPVESPSEFCLSIGISLIKAEQLPWIIHRVT